MPLSQTKQHSSKQPKLLVTGASGNLGHWLCREALGAWRVWGVHRQHPVDIDGVLAIKADLNDTSALKKMFSVIEPNAVIHAAAISQPALCEADPQGTHAVNVGVSRFLSGLCAQSGIPFILTSTDLVFNGLNPPYDEQAGVSPVCVYGRQKAEAETAVLEAYPGALVCRMPLMFGIGPRLSGNFSLEMLKAIGNNRSIPLFTDEFRTPVEFQSAARGLLGLLGQAQGILHMGGRSRVSRFEMGQLMARQMACPTSMLEPASIHGVSLGVTRSPDCSLISDTAYALGYDPGPLSAAMGRVVDQFNVISKG